VGTLRDLKKQDPEPKGELPDLTFSGILTEIQASEIAREKGMDKILDFVITLMEGMGGIDGIYEESSITKGKKTS
jgi:hypothetical protein